MTEMTKPDVKTWTLKWDREYQYTDGVPAEVLIAVGPEVPGNRSIQVVPLQALEDLRQQLDWKTQELITENNNQLKTEAKLERYEKALRWYRFRDFIMSRFERENADDSDFENNSTTNGYFPPRPSDDEVREFTEWMEAYGPARKALGGE